MVYEEDDYKMHANGTNASAYVPSQHRYTHKMIPVSRHNDVRNAFVLVPALAMVVIDNEFYTL